MCEASDKETAAVFLRRGDEFHPTSHAAGPWDPKTLHGGPVAGLLAFAALEDPPPEGFQVARMHFDLLRPVPAAALRTRVDTLREGRRLKLREARLFQGEVLLARGTLAILAERELPFIEESRFEAPPLPSPTGLASDHLTFRQDEPEQREARGFSGLAELRRVSGIAGGGRGAGWFRLPLPLVSGTAMTPWLRLASLSDFANGLSQTLLGGIGFINTDIGVRVMRPPEGEWIGFDSSCRIFPEGLGVVHSAVYDTRGQIGVIQQTVMAADRSWG